jgi:hypothetical protein
MQPRLSPARVAPDAYAAMHSLNTWNRLAIGFRYIDPVDAPKAA